MRCCLPQRATSYANHVPASRMHWVYSPVVSTLEFSIVFWVLCPSEMVTFFFIYIIIISQCQPCCESECTGNGMNRFRTGCVCVLGGWLLVMWKPLHCLSHCVDGTFCNLLVQRNACTDLHCRRLHRLWWKLALRAWRFNFRSNCFQPEGDCSGNNAILFNNTQALSWRD